MIRPVAVPVGQGYGENPTSKLPAGHWILKQFGNYQPDGHAGEDYPCPVGTPIRAVTSGKVLHVGFYGGTYRDNPYWIAPNFAGYCYVIDHGAFIGIYAHGMDKGARVKVGETVAEGQIIGLSGNTGGSTGPHLHFEALPDKFIVNSYMYGRINPATLFAGGLAAMGGTITPLSEEDDMPSIEEITALLDSRVDELTKRTNDQHVETRTQNEAQHLQTIETLTENTEAQHVETRKRAEDTRGYLAERVKGASPADLVSAIPDNIAQQVLDGLAARLGGK